MHAESLPRFADFLKSTTGHLLMCACRNPPHSLQISQICHWTFAHVYLQKFPPPGFQIFQNLPLDSYLHVLAEILPPPSLQILQNLLLDSYLHVLAEIPPWFADFTKSATGQLPMCADVCYTQL